uniref:Uncharacterized protein n=1 Tax=Anopheles farauti TaxID=69004 RepID=A0A182R0C8_9DIPT
MKDLNPMPDGARTFYTDRFACFVDASRSALQLHPVVVLLEQLLLALLESVAASSSSSSSSIETGERGECMLRSSGSVCSGSSLLMCTICCGVRDRLDARKSIAAAAAAAAAAAEATVELAVGLEIGESADIESAVVGRGPKLSGSVRPGNFWCNSIPGVVGIFEMPSSDRPSLDSEPPQTDFA